MNISRAPVEPVVDVAPAQLSVAARGLVLVVEAYRSWVSPMLLPSCRFDPTCSGYAVEALRTRGAVVGTVLALVRVIKCAPWHPGGWDPVPPARRKAQDDEETAGPC